MKFIVATIQVKNKITHVEAKDDLRPDTNGKILTKEEVIKDIKANKEFFTAIKVKDQLFLKKGAKVEVYTEHGEEFIRTVANSRPEDNLDSLPEVSKLLKDLYKKV